MSAHKKRNSHHASLYGLADLHVASRQMQCQKNNGWKVACVQKNVI